jgi:hypothetical protein
LGWLLVVDYVHPQDSRPEGVVFVFDGGVLDELTWWGWRFRTRRSSRWLSVVLPKYVGR